jgi:hypothetical protein
MKSHVKAAKSWSSSAISHYKSEAYGTEVSSNTAQICQNGIDWELAAIDCMLYALDWELSLVNLKPHVNDSKLPIFKMHASKCRMNASRCRLQALNRWLNTSDRHREAHDRQQEARNFEIVGFQLRICSFMSRAQSFKSIASAHQSPASSAHPAGWRILQTCRARCSPPSALRQPR